jgi:hypothetical protein
MRFPFGLPQILFRSCVLFHPRSDLFYFFILPSGCSLILCIRFLPISAPSCVSRAFSRGQCGGAQQQTPVRTWRSKRTEIKRWRSKTTKSIRVE